MKKAVNITSKGEETIGKKLKKEELLFVYW